MPTADSFKQKPVGTNLDVQRRKPLRSHRNFLNR
jgi:hypothetical protein